MDDKTVSEFMKNGNLEHHARISLEGATHGLQRGADRIALLLTNCFPGEKYSRDIAKLWQGDTTPDVLNERHNVIGFVIQLCTKAQRDIEKVCSLLYPEEMERLRRQSATDETIPLQLWNGPEVSVELYLVINALDGIYETFSWTDVPENAPPEVIRGLGLALEDIHEDLTDIISRCEEMQEAA
jgi:hypothetical protein